MELKDFYKNFIQDYELKKQRETIFKRDAVSVEEFNVQHFSEAIQEFADKICEQQRQLCLYSLVRAHSESPYSDGSITPEVRSDAILCCQQPDIEELFNN
jgi:hypothetical protein